MSGLTGISKSTDLITQVETVNSVISFLGLALDSTALDADAKWKVTRTSSIGKIVKDIIAGDGEYNQVWNDRNDGIMFPPLDLLNNFSTFFDGNNDHLDFGDAHNFDNAKAWSLSMWVKPDNITQQRCLWSKTTDDSDVFGWGLYINNTGKIFLQMRASGQNRQHTFGITLQANVWQHIVLTVSGNQNINGCKIYIDNVLDTIPATGTVTNTLITTESSRIGRRNAAFHYSGFMDRVTFWNKSLSDSEVSQMYNNRIFISPITQSFVGDLLHYYRMGDDDTVVAMIDNHGAINGILKNFPSVIENIYFNEVA